LVARESH